MNYIVIGSALLCIILGIFQYAYVKRKKSNDKELNRVSGYIRQGAMAYLKRQYIVIAVFCVCMAVILSVIPGLGTGAAIAFLVGASFSVLSGFIGMRASTSANAATTEAAKTSVTAALKVAYSGGSVLGLFVVGLGVLGIGVLYLILGDANLGVITGFSLGASSVALFCRVGGGIFTKAADVGADLVGKVEAGIPEDDPRNPAVIADNVGDNVGDVAGMGADLFESYVGSVISTMLLGFVALGNKGVAFTLLITASGLVASVIGVIIVKLLKSSNISLSLNMGTYVSGVLIIGATLAFSLLMLGDIKYFFPPLSGIVSGLLIGKITEYYTSSGYSHVKKIAEHCGTGSATNILSGLAVGMKSSALPVLLIAAATIISFNSAGMFGIALAAVGMLATVANVIAVDGYGPIADNAGGLAQMTAQKADVRRITDSLDSVGNTTAAIAKGFSISSAALTALAFFSTYATTVKLDIVSVLDPYVISGMFVGAMLTYLFSAMAIEAVSKAANKMVDEVRRQFREIKGIMTGESVPEYAKCVDISTKAALREMIIPGLMAVAAPIATGLLLGKGALAGLLVGATIMGVPLAIQMANSGGAWDNAKKYIEEGNHGGKGSGHHKAAVIGDTVGDPMKDTAGPSMNILIKLMGIVAIVFAPLFLR